MNLDGQPADEAVLLRMARIMRHRGPDDDGTHIDGNAGLAFQRLAIIDLSPAGHQPMSNGDRSLWLVFNGEIYNYRELADELRAAGHEFRSRSDSEVILHAYEEYGEACLERFNGMFAIAIWDARRRSFWLARDRVGVKPLYYMFNGTRFAFASEIKALLELDGADRRANPDAIAQYLKIGYSIDDQTWFAGIKKIMPGWSARMDADGTFTQHQYWDVLEQYRTPQFLDNIPARIRALLEDSVRLRLRSDVPIGAHLSGGLDSSSIVALMARLGDGTVNTFSAAFPEGGQYDERPFIHQVVRHYRTAHYEVEPLARQLPKLLPRLIWHMDEPTAGPGSFPQYLVCRLTAEHGVKVVSGGQGGDELFGGYPRYLLAQARQQLYHAIDHKSPGEMAALVGQMPLFFRQIWSLQRLHSVAGRLVPSVRSTSVFHPDIAALLEDARLALPSNSDDPLVNLMYNDLRYYLPALLQVEDRTSMAASIESRTPLLDYRLVELAATIPSGEKMKGGELKRQLRKAVHDILPPGVAHRRDKRGLPTPISIWFRGELSDWVQQVVFSEQAREIRVFSLPAMERALTLHRCGLIDASRQLWSAANIALWFEQFSMQPAW